MSSPTCRAFASNARKGAALWQLHSGTGFASQGGPGVGAKLELGVSLFGFVVVSKGNGFLKTNTLRNIFRTWPQVSPKMLDPKKCQVNLFGFLVKPSSKRAAALEPRNHRFVAQPLQDNKAACEAHACGAPCLGACVFGKNGFGTWLKGHQKDKLGFHSNLETKPLGVGRDGRQPLRDFDNHDKGSYSHGPCDGTLTP